MGFVWIFSIYNFAQVLETKIDGTHHVYTRYNACWQCESAAAIPGKLHEQGTLHVRHNDRTNAVKRKMLIILTKLSIMFALHLTAPMDLYTDQFDSHQVPLLQGNTEHVCA